MRSLFCFTIIGIVALAMNGYAQGPPQKPDRSDSTKALYMVTGLH